MYLRFLGKQECNWSWISTTNIIKTMLMTLDRTKHRNQVMNPPKEWMLVKALFSPAAAQLQ